MSPGPAKTLFAYLAGLIGRGSPHNAHPPPQDNDRDSFLAPILYPWWEKAVPPRRLWEGPHDPFVHFIRWSFEYRAYLPLLCGLASDSIVLELGCSHGRTMLALIGYLRAPGRYEGLDIVAEKIEFAQKHIHETFSEFNFTFANVYNPSYNQSADAIPADRFRFPYSDNTFDVAFAASLFTHLQPPAVENYFRQTRRTLKKGGKCLFSFFVLDYFRGPGSGSWPGYEFNHPLPGFDGVAIRDRDQPENLIAYRSEKIRDFGQQAGLSMTQIIAGDWSRTEKVIVHEQDLVVFQAI